MRTYAVASVIALWSVAAQGQVAVSAPAMPGGGAITCTNLQLEKKVPCPDSEMFFHEGNALVERAFHAKNFKELDALFDKWSTGKDRFPDGGWKLSTYTKGLASLFNAWNNWEKYLADIKQWQTESPGSFAAKYTEAIYWRNYAWKARGNGYARTISKESWELFNERLAIADKILESIRPQARTRPSWYPIKISLSMEMNRSDSEVHQLFVEGAKLFPEYHEIYLKAATAYEPRWGGSPEEFEAFAVEAAKLAGKFEGLGMYARLYWNVDYANVLPFMPDVSATPSWERLRPGFEELRRRYPSSIYILNQYASVACRANDAALYRDLRTRIAGYVDEDAFKVMSADACDRRHRWQAK